MALSKSHNDPGFVALWQRLGANVQLVSRLVDIGEGRIRDMDATGIAVQVLSLTSPGVQVFDAATANTIARLVLGHGGEALPFWLSRIDYFSRVRPNPPKGGIKLKRKPSEYMKENIYVTTSGMAWSPVITFLQSVLGVERVLYAMDYPYQYEPDEVTATDSVPISTSDKKKLFQTNAEKVFAL